MTELDQQEAYRAMYEFLAGHYRRTNSDDIGALLGSLSTLADGQPADPAVWQDWREAVRKAKACSVDTRLETNH